MKTVSWVAGILGIVIALIGIIGGMRAPLIGLMGRTHAPSTFISLGIFLLAFGMWIGLLGLYPKK